ncbi:hypothetical protein GCM10022240_09190 [Microbacterium kribbense]|uniref:Dienelactone hydrolase domain-containing protein n=1 Tax=Microbacterium kribbense TaxID=433645 RepID=A0ABP7GB97_9MICO
MSEVVSLPQPDSSEPLEVYVARPDGARRGGLIVIHEIWGLTDHIRDVADRFAAQGWLVAAPDILTHAGVTPAAGTELFALMNDPDEKVRVAAQPRMRDALAEAHDPGYAAWALRALRTAVDWLAAQPGAGGRLAATGYCFGGTYTFLLAASDDRIRAAAPFYGAAPDTARIAAIEAPVLAFYGGQDATLMKALPTVREQMAAAEVDFTPVVYPDAHHAFFNDTGSRYDADAAADAWAKVTVFLADAVA